MLFRKMASLALIAILFGCNHPAIKKSESVATQHTSFVFVIPAAETAGGYTPFTTQNMAEKIIFKNYRHYGDRESPEIANLDAVKWKIQEKGFSVENYKATYGRDSGIEYNKVSVTYDGSLQMEKSGRNYQMTFSLDKKHYYAEPAGFSGKPRYQVAFSPSEVTANLAEAEMPWKIEVDSKFNTESTYANFVRMTRREALLGEDEIDTATGVSIKERFWVNLSGKEIPVKIVTYPYQNRSKTVVYANLPGTVSGKNTIDFVKTLDALKKEIERIVNS